MDQWPASGIPQFPRVWILQTARHKAIDRLRRQTLFAERIQSRLADEPAPEFQQPDYDTGEIPNERLRLIFTCCHPALASDTQVALTLRTSLRIGDRGDRPGVSRARLHNVGALLAQDALQPQLEKRDSIEGVPASQGTVSTTATTAAPTRVADSRCAVLTSVVREIRHAMFCGSRGRVTAPGDPVVPGNWYPTAIQ